MLEYYFYLYKSGKWRLFIQSSQKLYRKKVESITGWLCLSHNRQKRQKILGTTFWRSDAEDEEWYLWWWLFCTKLIFLLYTIWKVRSTQDTYIELEDAYNLLLPIYFFHLCVYAEENMQCRHDMMSNCRLFEPYSKWNSDIDQAIKANSSLGIFSMPWLGRLVKRVKVCSYYA